MNTVEGLFAGCTAVGWSRAENTVGTPLGSCEANSHSDQSFWDGKCLRMGHYAKILLARFRRNRRVYQ